MPINIPADLPARSALEEENIFVMSDAIAHHQDIRPLQIALVNLMPTKIATEIQLLRLLGNSPIQVDVTLIRAENHIASHTSVNHLERFYKTFSQVKQRKFDGMIVTGAPIEQMPFEQVDYWTELEEIMDYSAENVFSTLYICWGAQAGLYHRFGIPKYLLPEKLFGVFPHKVCKHSTKLLRGFDDRFYMPHSRHTEIRKSDILKVPQLEILTESAEAGPSIIACRESGELFVTGHFEYDAETLDLEYKRDFDKGLNPEVPANYYPENNPSLPPLVSWRAHAHLFYNNWLNYHVYQATPYNVDSIEVNLKKDATPE
ncbi:MAG: homoserine O-succinyltransferase [Deltaproteobacteria bacterium]|jgi:homoserine O-succinyltransferase|nr:homoserine O-succinyltransferase [Deltaproteobacteria bacterium]